MRHIGYLHIRSVDAFKYDIYQDNDIIFSQIKNKSYELNIPQRFVFSQNKIDLVLYNEENYDDYIKTSTMPPIYLTINDEKIKNDDIIDDIFNHIKF